MTAKDSDFITYGFSCQMGPKLRRVVEQHLLDDLCYYITPETTLSFDWSNSVIEGHAATYLNGNLENFSGIALIDNKGNTIADGWMEFIFEGGFFLAYWDSITRVTMYWLSECCGRQVILDYCACFTFPLFQHG